ncbi:two-component regulator propeller domain-containing protein [Alishewanella jeotgali]|uniref:histidine kinase n=1 Tax=Alishewanella jeotgali KCTC 22429 TaxID=1129374 RepID=H3ZEJ2_9ALTE|nr:two-component regulator propeller domain-containing protein [Alishewanella jeotgali]EHR40955.1 histidine kinase [Alishewanella jeotgali KCTC 22429]
MMLLVYVALPLRAVSQESIEHSRVFSRFIQLSVPGRSLPVPTTMTQDQQGFLWLGTQHGLYRYDGTDLQEFRANPGQSGSLSAGWVSALASDPQGWLWVGTRYGGLNRFDPVTESFVRFELPGPEDVSSAEISALVFDQSQQLWITSYGAGLFKWQHEQLQPVTLPTIYSELAVKFINSLFIDTSGGQWLAIGEAPLRTYGQQRGGALYRANEQSDWQEVGFASDAPVRASVSKINQSLDGTVWAATYGQGLYLFDTEQQIFQLARQPEPLKQALLSDLHFDAEGGLWLTSYSADHRGGLWHRDQQGNWVHYPFQAEFSEGLARADLLALFQDQQGILWTVSQGGFRGLSRFARAIRTLPNGQTGSGLLAAPNVLGIDAVAENSIWLANREGGVAHFDPQTAILKYWLLPDGPEQPTLVQAVHQDNDGTLYVGTDRGLYRLVPATSEWQNISLYPAAEPFVRLLYRDRQQNLWIGTRGHGLFRLAPDRTQLEHYRRADGREQIRFEDINNVTEDYLGAIWIGSTDQGVARYQPETGEVEYWLQHAGSQHGLQLNGIQLMLEDQSQRLWIRAGNINHLVLRDPDQPALVRGFKPYLTLDDYDTALQQAPFFRLLYRLHWLEEQQTYLELNEMHGMQSSTWIGAWDILGTTIYRGGARGFDYFDINKLPKRVALNQVQLTALSLFNQPVRAGSALLPQTLANLEQLVLTYDQDMFSIRFASPEYKQAQQIQYRYQLKGFDRDWIQTSAQSPVATYTRLPPGDYLFKVAARLPDGQWTTDTELSVRVLPPWWLTWWFKLILFLLLLLTVMVVLRWRLQREYQLRRKLELLVEKRTAQLAEQNQALELSYQRLQQTQQQLITQEKMASLGGLVAGVAHEINTPLGICVTATSHLQNEQAQLAEAAANRTMLQSQFNRFMQQLSDGLKILQVNTQRAADLVNSFKQVSVDQSHDSYREFELCQYLNDVLLSLRSRLKQQHCELTFDCPQPIIMYSDPGAIAQVVTNLVMNALIHGLDGHPAPKIRLLVEDTASEVLIHFSDNGKGMTDEELKQLFDPFFTTKRNQGGSGLGAHIVYNLVTVRLHGTISVSSQPMQGLHYLLRLTKQVT